MSNEADTCRKDILPKLIYAGWDTEPRRINEQISFTDGRIVLAGSKVSRRPQKRADFLLRYRREDVEEYIAGQVFSSTTAAQHAKVVGEASQRVSLPCYSEG